MPTAIDAAITIEPMTCGGCGVVFGLSSNFIYWRKRDHKTWYCPNGCRRYYSSESDEERLKRELRQAHDYNAQTRQELARERKSHAATKGKLTKTIKRAGAGICPYCTRTFKQVQAHIAKKHPDG